MENNDLYSLTFNYYVDEFVRNWRLHNNTETNKIFPIIFQFWRIDFDLTRREIIANRFRRFFEIKKVTSELHKIERESVEFSIIWAFRQKAAYYDELENDFFDGAVGDDEFVKQRFFEILMSINVDAVFDQGQQQQQQQTDWEQQ